MITAAEPTPDRRPPADRVPPTPGAAGPNTPAETAAERRRRINRKNAARSTGPRTAAGLAKSSNNAYKHGLYARAAVVPGGEVRAYRDWLAEWADQFAPDGPAEVNAVERGAHASW